MPSSDTSSTIHEDPQHLSKAHCVTIAPVPTVESILEWPIFDNLGFEIQGRSLALVHDLDPDLAYSSPCPPIRTRTRSYDREFYSESALVESDVKVGIQSFLDNVHPKNPIVEPGPLQDAANNCQLNGFGTDGFSALVVSTALS